MIRKLWQNYGELTYKRRETAEKRRGKGGEPAGKRRGNDGKWLITDGDRRGKSKEIAMKQRGKNRETERNAGEITVNSPGVQVS